MRARAAVGKRWWQVGLVAVGLALAAVVGALAGPDPAQGGLVVGCPDGPDTSLGTIHLAGLTVTPEGASQPTVAVLLSFADLVAALGDPEARNLDTDADGLPDLR